MELNFDEPGSHHRARELMGENFQGVTAAQTFLNRAFSEKDLQQRKELRLFDEVRHLYMSEDETLSLCEECRDTHLMQATYSLSVIGIHAQVPHLFDHHPKNTWFKDVHEKEWTSVALVHPWQLIRKDGMPHSRNKNVDWQRSLITTTLPKERSILPVEHVYGALLHQSHTGKKLCQNDWVRFLIQASGGFWVSADWSRGRLYIDSIHGSAGRHVITGSARIA